MTTTCTAINAATRHFAHAPGDLLPCGHEAVRQADGSLACDGPTPVIARRYIGGDRGFRAYSEGLGGEGGNGPWTTEDRARALLGEILGSPEAGATAPLVDAHTGQVIPTSVRTSTGAADRFRREVLGPLL
jgi:hypothetical protein